VLLWSAQMPTQKQTNTPIVESKTSEITYHPNDLVLNKYRIINKLGAGGMSSIVYKAEDTTIKDNEFLTNKEKFVAIKVVNRDANWSDAD
jgi:serine/threonine protein kinase